MVTVFDCTPPMEIVTGTAGPEADVAGTCAFTWYRPTNPGARPENLHVSRRSADRHGWSCLRPCKRSARARTSSSVTSGPKRMPPLPGRARWNAGLGSR